MPRTADFHEQITDADRPEAAGVMDEATAFDATVDLRDAHAPAGDAPIRRCRCARAGTASWLPGRHDELSVVEGERQDAPSLAHAAPRGPGVGGRLRHPFLVGATSRGRTENEARQRRVDPPHMCHRVARFLAALTARLRRRILGAPDAPLGTIRPTRGEVGAGAGRAAGAGGCSGRTTIAVIAAAATPRRFARSVKDRAGASPSVCRVAGRTTNHTCIH